MTQTKIARPADYKEAILLVLWLGDPVLSSIQIHALIATHFEKGATFRERYDYLDKLTAEELIRTTKQKHTKDSYGLFYELTELGRQRALRLLEEEGSY
jgi:DNA-binding PadR family transcriptional regulator